MGKRRSEVFNVVVGVFILGTLATLYGLAFFHVQTPFIITSTMTNTSTITNISTETTTISRGGSLDVFAVTFTSTSPVTSTLSQATRVFNLTSANSTSTDEGTLLVAKISGYMGLVIYAPSTLSSPLYIYIGTSESGTYSLGNDCSGGANPSQCVANPGQTVTLPGGEGTWLGLGFSQIPVGIHITIVETV